jgi:sortase family protein
MLVGGGLYPPTSFYHRERKRRSRIQVMIAVFVLLVGIFLVCYPFVSNVLNQLEQDKVSVNQQQVVEQLEPEDLSAQKQAALDYNARLFAGSVRVVDPFDTGDYVPGNAEYEQMLNLAGDGVMGRLVIPKIEVDLPIYHYTNDEVLGHGVGHVVQTSLPIGGASSHCVLAGHTGLPAARIFEQLDRLTVGDWFVIQVLGENHAYRVTKTEVVLPEEVSSLAIEPDRDLVTLVTCTPYGVNSHRLLVHAERCEVPSEWDNGSETVVRSVSPLATPGLPIWVWSLAGAGVALVIVVVTLIVQWRRRRGYGR